ncbi:ATP-binding protein [Paraburkholderia caribensis]|uniref:ATP-binding protein n=1 Tax=Paraburkholderia caribensis TaxID=75105 RepID=UPI001D07E8FE|nr:ATP-binding protein [Paraburkholderia caribensis]
MNATVPHVLPAGGSLLAFAETAALDALQSLGRPDEGDALAAIAETLERCDTPHVMHRIADGFALDPAEVALVLLLFAAALSEPVARGIAQACPGGAPGVPLWLAQRLVCRLRIDSLSAHAALRRFGFVALEDDVPRIESRIWLRDAVLDRLCGAPSCEPEVEARIARVPVNPALAREDVVRGLRETLGARGADRLSPVGCLESGDVATIAACLQALGLVPYLIAGDDIPQDAVVRDRLARHWSRDAALDGAALIVVADSLATGLIAGFIDRVAGHVILAGARPCVPMRRSIRDIVEDREGADGVLDRWRRTLGPASAAKLGSGLVRVAAQFALRPDEIDALCTRIGPDIERAADGPEATRTLWHAAGRVASGAMPPGVSLVEPAYRWSDLVLPIPVESALRRVEIHVRHATTVLDEWGFGERMGGRGRGVAALFAGPSGTGKTMAAEVLASSLDLRVMVIDLSQMISKYIGETSKNVAAAFRMAERCGAVMVWNEGDAIWGARGAVGNATDRHVNAEIGDLLQRIELFRGFTVVTTNLRHAIDPAFLRRFRFMVDFPMPSQDERLRLWRQAFPHAAPLGAIDWQVLASLPLSGGSIRNVALGSAFLAADGGGVIDARRIAAELAEELRKHDQPMPVLNLEATA